MLRVDRGVEERAAATVPASIGDASQAPGDYARFRFTGDGAFPWASNARPCQLVTRSYPGFEHPVPSSERSVHRFDRGGPDGRPRSLPTGLSARKVAGASYSATRRTDAARFAGSRFFAAAGLERRLAGEARPASDRGYGWIVDGNESPQQQRQRRFHIRAVPQRLALWESRWTLCAHPGRRSDDPRAGNF